MLIAGLACMLAAAPAAVAQGEEEPPPPNDVEAVIFDGRNGEHVVFIRGAAADPSVDTTGATATVTVSGGGTLELRDAAGHVCTIPAPNTVSCTVPAGGTQRRGPFVVQVSFPQQGLTPYTITAQVSGPSDTNPANNTFSINRAYFRGAATPGALPTPVQGRLVNASRVSGVVRIRRPGGRFVVLQAGQQIPVGSIVDVTRGRVRLESAGATAGAVNSAEFYRGQFLVRQRRGASLTQLFLQGGNLAACPRRSASASELQRKRSRKPSPRRLWGKGKGDYQTVGRNSATTVRGTTWLVEDRCDGTFTRVTEGRVAVRDFVRRRTVLLRAPQAYLARRR